MQGDTDEDSNFFQLLKLRANLVIKAITSMRSDEMFDLYVKKKG